MFLNATVDLLQPPPMWKTMIVKKNLEVVELKPTSKEYTDMAATFTKSFGRANRYSVVKVKYYSII